MAAMDKVERKAYNKEYHRRYKLERKLDREERDRLRKENPIIVRKASPAKPLVFRGMVEQTCSHFGCGRLLSHTEQLFGNKCIHHSKI